MPVHNWEKEAAKGSFAAEISLPGPAFGQRREVSEDLRLQEGCQVLSPAHPLCGLVIGPCNRNVAAL